MPNKPTTVEEYIHLFPEETQSILNKIRHLVLRSHPLILESIAYGMPAYKLNKKPLVYFGAFSNHLGFYATPTGHEAFFAKLAPFKQGKGSVQFPLKKPIPWGLISEIIQFRIHENLDLQSH